MEEKRISIPETIYRIRLGSTKTQPKEGKRPYILKHAAKPLDEKSKLIFLLDKEKKNNLDLRAECKKAHERMAEHSIPLEEGPYADRDGKIIQLATHIREIAESKEKGEDSIIETVIDVIGLGNGLPLKVNYYLYRESEDLPTAGSILTEKERREEDETDGSTSIVLCNPFESLILATGVLRRMNLNAYPAHSVFIRPDGEEGILPVIALLDLDAKSETPLTTFPLHRKEHPPIGAIDLISDEAVEGATYAFQAQNVIKKIGRMIVDIMENENREITEEEVKALLKSVAEFLVESKKRWEGSIFMLDTIGQLAVSETDRLLMDLPNIPLEIIQQTGNEFLGAFTIIFNAHLQMEVIRIQKNTEPKNVELLLSDERVLRSSYEDALRKALTYRKFVYDMYMGRMEEEFDSVN